MKKVLKTSLSLLLAITIIFSSAYVGLSEVDFERGFGIEANAISYVGVSGHTVVDSIVFNGATTEAVYTNYYGSGYNSDTTYCCAAFVKRFYSNSYGINVWNLTFQKTPLANDGSFSVTTSPKVGDIVRRNSKTHWMIVKAVSGTTVTLIEQNWWTSPYSQAPVNRTISTTDSDYTFFRYSKATDGGSTPSQPSASFVKAVDYAISDNEIIDVLSRSQLYLQGWAYDTNGAETTVYWAIDDVGSTAFKKVDRPDVGASQVNCGFAESIDLTKYSLGTHKLSIWCTSSNGSADVFCRYFTLTTSDNQDPVFHEVNVAQMYENGYTVTARVSDNIGVTTVYFPTWIPGQTGNDAKWLQGVYDPTYDHWACWIPTSEWGNHYGTYYTHVYATDAAGNGLDVEDGYSGLGDIRVPSLNSACDSLAPLGTYDLSQHTTIDAAGWVYNRNGDNVKIHYRFDNGIWHTFNLVDRTDVPAQLSDCKQVKCGYNQKISIADLTSGQHTIDIIAESNGLTKVVASKTFTVVRPKAYGNFTFNANGGTLGSSGAFSVAYGKTFEILNTTCTRSGYTWAGWQVKRNNDNKWFVDGRGWCSESDINTYSYTKKLYGNYETHTLNDSWVSGLSGDCSYTFYAVWIQNPVTQFHVFLSTKGEGVDCISAKNNESGSGYAQNRIYVWHALFDKNTGNLFNSYAVGSYSVELSIYDPNGDLVHSCSYDNSDNNWISIVPQMSGRYTAKAVLSGDMSGTVVAYYDVSYNPQLTSSEETISLTLNSTNSINTTNSKQTTISVSGNYPGSCSVSYSVADDDIASATWGEWDGMNIPLTITGNRIGTTNISISLHENYSGKNEVIKTITIPVIVGVDAIAIDVNSAQTTHINIGEKTNYYSFIPEESGKYVIFSDCIEDTRVYLYDALGNEISYDDDGGSYSNFRLEQELTAGKKYIFGINFYDSSTTGSILFKLRKIYNVRYDANGGIGAPDAQTKEYRENISLSSIVPTREGYTFAGWNTKADGSGTSYASGTTYKDNADVTLYAQWVEITSIRVSKQPNKTEYDYGESLDTTGLEIEVTYSDGSTEIITSGFTTSELNSTALGMRKITVSYENKTTSFYVTVRTPYITISSTSETLNIGDSILLKATTSPSGQTVTWTSSNSFVATVDNHGLVTAMSAGSATITAKFVSPYNSVICSATCTVTVTEPHKHTTSDWVIDIEPTCSKEGSKHKECIDCGEILETEAIIKLAHDFIDDSCTVCGTEIMLEYSVENDSVTITGYNGTDASVVIPSSIDGLPVISIGNYAFSSCTSITSITIPDSVTSIDYCAFYQCTNLKSITIPNSVTSIGKQAFYSCRSLTAIYVDEKNPNYSSAEGVLFNNDKTKLIRYPASKSGNCYTIPDSVTSIDTSAFESCANLVSITIPDSVTGISFGAFYYCSSLTSIIIPDSVISIDGKIFDNCTSLIAINVDENNTNYSSAEGVLFNKDKTVLIKYPEGKTETAYSIPCGVTSISDSAFEDCESLTSITIPDSVTSIGEWAFCKCNGLTSITIPDSVTSINSCAFYDCDKLASVTLSKNITRIRSNTFYNCNNLASIAIPDGVTRIDSRAFEWCPKLESVTIPKTITNIDNYAFSNCSALKNVYYEGLLSDWDKISIGSNNECLTDATISHLCTLGDWEIDAESTCEENGSRSRKCLICGEIAETDVIIATGHSYSTEWTIDVEANCAVAGSKSHHCTVCGNKIDVTIINALGHYFEDDVCLKCDTVLEKDLSPVIKTGVLQSKHNYDSNTAQTEIFSAFGAKYIVIKFSSDTFVENKYDKIYIYDASDVLVGTYTGSELANKTITIDGDTVKIKLTSDSSVEKYGYYANCEAYGAPLTCNNHLHKKLVNVVEETCSNEGYTGDVVCVVCETVVESGKVIPPLSHTFSEWTIDVEPTCTEEGSKSHHCTVCGEKTDITVVTASGHNYVVQSAEKNHPHTTTYKCSFCESTKEETQTFFDCVECNFTINAIDSSSYKLVSYIGTETDVVIPATYNGRTITTVANSCFRGNTTITSVKIADGVTTLGSLVFMNCTSLEKVIIPASVTSIGSQAFYGFTGVIYCTSGSYAHEYAVANNIDYVLVSIMETGDTRIDYDNLVIYTSIENCGDIAELFIASENVLVIPTASHTGGNLEFYGTGTIITVFDGDDYIGDFTLVVNGDTNGDSVCDALDAAQVALVSNGQKSIDGAYKMAADSNSDETVDIEDYQAIVNKVVS